MARNSLGPYKLISELLHNAAPSGRSSATAPSKISAPNANTNANAKTQAIQDEIDATVKQLGENIERIHERGQKLDVLQDKSDQLALHSQLFRTEARRTRRQMWCKNAKWTICLSVLGILIVAGVVAGAIEGKKRMDG